MLFRFERSGSRLSKMLDDIFSVLLFLKNPYISLEMFKVNSWGVKHKKISEILYNKKMSNNNKPHNEFFGSSTPLLTIKRVLSTLRLSIIERIRCEKGNENFWKISSIVTFQPVLLRCLGEVSQSSLEQDEMCMQSQSTSTLWFVFSLIKQRHPPKPADVSNLCEGEEHSWRHEILVAEMNDWAAQKWYQITEKKNI